MNPNESQELSEAVRQAEVCGNELAALYVRTHNLTGNKAAGVQDCLSKYLTYCNLVIEFDGDKQRADEAVREMEKSVTGIKIPVKGESNEFRVECHVGPYHGPVEHTSESGRQSPVHV
jgi:hypothetical protein